MPLEHDLQQNRWFAPAHVFPILFRLPPPRTFNHDQCSVPSHVAIHWMTKNIVLSSHETLAQPWLSDASLHACTSSHKRKRIDAKLWLSAGPADRHNKLQKTTRICTKLKFCPKHLNLSWNVLHESQRMPNYTYDPSTLIVIFGENSIQKQTRNYWKSDRAAHLATVGLWDQFRSEGYFPTKILFQNASMHRAVTSARLPLVLSSSVEKT